MYAGSLSEFRLQEEIDSGKSTITFNYDEILIAVCGVNDNRKIGRIEPVCKNIFRQDNKLSALLGNNCVASVFLIVLFYNAVIARIK